MNVIDPKLEKKLKGLEGKDYIEALSRHSIDGRIKINLDDLEDYDNLEKTYLKENPIIYDTYKLWWSWDLNEHRWKMVDETDISISFNSILKLESNAFKSSIKSTIINALKDSARKFYYTRVEKNNINNIVFKNKIYNIKTKELSDNSYNYYSTNPIPYDFDQSFLETPNIDKLFKEWVGEKNVQILYEIIGYCMLSDYPIHRAFCLIGRGRNGKSKYLEIVSRVIGNYNITASDLNVLSKNTFESASLYKKLVCTIGETDYNIMSDTSLFKRLTGQDRLGAQFKNKPKFEFINYAKILIATNNLPTTTDKTDAFYARWIIVDFPNQFEGTRDILLDIPEEEYGFLANKCLNYLVDVLKEGKFHNEGSILEKQKIFEEKSNPLQMFIDKFCIEDPSEHIFVYEFYDRLTKYLIENGYRQLSKALVSQTIKSMNFELGKEFNSETNKQYRCYYGLRFRTKEDDNKVKINDFVFDINNKGNIYTLNDILAKFNKYKTDYVLGKIKEWKRLGYIGEIRVGEYRIYEDLKIN